MKFGSLFSGIGGMDLGLERAGMECAWQVEIDPFCREVLEKHWPNVTRYEDVRTVDWSSVAPVDLIAGGFPCQDISRAGRRAGLAGKRSGLWSEFARCVRDLRPSVVLVENSTSLLVRGMGEVLGDLAALGYSAEWDCLPAAYFGLPHIRDRAFIVADAGERRHGAPKKAVFTGRPSSELRDWRTSEPGVLRVADGVPSRVDRLRGLGNAVVPQVAEWIGRRILECSEGQSVGKG